MIRIAILTVSDKSARGEREDASGPAIREALREQDVEFVDYRVVPDEQHDIAEALFHFSERDDVDVILTTGGTGLAPRDVTPQATLGTIEYEIPGIAEAMRAESRKVTPANAVAWGSRGAEPDPNRESAG